MSNKQKEYNKLRLMTICLTTIMLPFGTFVGFEFGAKHTKVALIALSIQTVITFMQAHIWWLTFEKGNS